MRVSTSWPFVVLALGAGCAAMQVRERLAGARGAPVAAVDQATFDGVYLDGRVLVGAGDGGYVVIDRRLTEHVLLVADGALDCDGGSPLPHIAADGPYFSPGPEDLLRLETGDWFGRDFSLLIYDEGFVNAPPPGCLDALLSVRFAAVGPSGGAGHVRLKVRAYLTRDGGPAADVDAGASDGGVVDLRDSGQPVP